MRRASGRSALRPSCVPAAAASARRNCTGGSGCRAGGPECPATRRGRRSANQAMRTDRCRRRPRRSPGSGSSMSRSRVAEPAEQLAETGDLLLIDAVKRFRRHVAAGHAGAAGRDHDIDLRVGDPRRSWATMAARSSRTTARAATRCPDASASAASVSPDRSSRRRAGVGYGQKGDVDGQERTGLVESAWHFRLRCDFPRFDAANKATPQPRFREYAGSVLQGLCRAKPVLFSACALWRGPRPP